MPVLEKARRKEGIKATIIGDRLLVIGKSYFFDKIPKERQEVPVLLSATHDDEPGSLPVNDYSGKDRTV